MIEQLKQWVTAHLQSVLRSTVRVAEVVSTDPQRATVRVALADQDGMVSHDLAVLMRKTHRDRDYWMPDVGDQVLCLFLPFGLEQGFILGSFYSKADPPPVADQDKHRVTYDDGAIFEYDRAAHRLFISLPGDREVEIAGNAHLIVGGNLTALVGGTAAVEASQLVHLTAPLTQVSGDLAVSGGITADGNMDAGGNISTTGNISATGTIIDGSGNTNNHSHN